MHGRKKADQRPRSAAEEEALQAKITKYQQLSRVALERRRQAPGEEEERSQALLLTGQLLRVNPDMYTLWNQRKELMLITSKVDEEEADHSTVDIESMFADELILAAECIKKNPKSYGAWYHRMWCFEVMRRLVARQAKQREALARLLDMELVLCGRFLDADERNFHCWNYRRYVVSAHPERSPKMEFDYSTERIVKNFSNYSAFHHRSTYIRAMLSEEKEQASLSEREGELLEGELDMVKQAMYTEPDDQTAWWYHQYLIHWASTSQDTDKFQETLRNEIESVKGIVEDTDGEYRWAVMALASLLGQLAATLGQGQEKDDTLEEARAVYNRLIDVDPDHRNRYQAILRSITR